MATEGWGSTKLVSNKVGLGLSWVVLGYIWVYWGLLKFYGFFLGLLGYLELSRALCFFWVRYCVILGPCWLLGTFLGILWLHQLDTVRGWEFYGYHDWNEGKSFSRNSGKNLEKHEKYFPEIPELFQIPEKIRKMIPTTKI